MAHVERLAMRFGRDAIPRRVIAVGFGFRGSTVKLIGPQGIVKPSILDLPLTITSAPSNPYGDLVQDDYVVYRYFQTDPNHRDNSGLRKAMDARLPLIYFHGIVEGIYALFSPVYVVEELRGQLAFRIAVAENLADTSAEGATLVAEEPARAYRACLVLQRLYQAAFSQRVLRACRHSCSVCNLRHRELLDAAHIVPDTDVRGVPVVSNGLPLCKLHHAAFDSYMIGISPSRIIEVRRDILDEHDGPCCGTVSRASMGSQSPYPGSGLTILRPNISRCATTNSARQVERRPAARDPGAT
jgi:putative restriction endonuclease